MSDPKEPVFLDEDDGLIDPAKVLCILREHLSEALGLPYLINDEADEAFVATDDLSTYDLSGFNTVRFDIDPKVIALKTKNVP